MKATKSDSPPQAVIIAGPNGSGKSTCAALLLPPSMPFVNADMIAAELSGTPGTPGDINAGRHLISRLEALEAERSDFAFETTLATKMLADRVDKWQANGYQVHLLYFWLPSADMAVERVAQRVRTGGHNVPESTIRRRYRKGLELLFSTYMPRVDKWRIYDNSRGLDPTLVAKLGSSGECTVAEPAIWDNISEASKHP
jgi:predicted ABC-type ATPase